MLTHLDENGNASMVDISDKNITVRIARAQAFIELSEDTIKLIQDKKIPKGDIFSVSRIAAIMAAKKTSDLIPLTHPIPINKVDVSFENEPHGIRIISEVKTSYKTGVEMEALVAASIAALTIYDMVKALEKGAIIKDVRLLYKSGGKSGTYERKQDK